MYNDVPSNAVPKHRGRYFVPACSGCAVHQDVRTQPIRSCCCNAMATAGHTPGGAQQPLVITGPGYFAPIRLQVFRGHLTVFRAPLTPCSRTKHISPVKRLRVDPDRSYGTLIFPQKFAIRHTANPRGWESQTPILPVHTSIGARNIAHQAATCHTRNFIAYATACSKRRVTQDWQSDRTRQCMAGNQGSDSRFIY